MFCLVLAADWHKLFSSACGPGDWNLRAQADFTVRCKHSHLELSTHDQSSHDWPSVSITLKVLIVFMQRHTFYLQMCVHFHVVYYDLYWF